MNKVIITGATSMIGVALVKECIKKRIAVIALVRPLSDRMKRLPSSPLLQLIECDLTQLEKLEHPLLKDSDALIHLAWNGTNKTDRFISEIQERNIKYTLDAVQLAHRAGCRRFIGIGSQAEYGSVDGVIAPGRSVAPEMAYGVAKYAAGQLSRLSCEKFGIEDSWCRVFSVYGPWDNKGTLVRTTLEKLLDNQDIETTKAEQIWDYLYVADAARAILQLTVAGKRGQTYNIGSGIGRPLREYLEIMQHGVNSKGMVKFGALPYAERQIMYLQADISSLVQDTGFTLQYTFEQGIKETIDWMQEEKNGK